MFSSLICKRVCSGICQATSVFSQSCLSVRDLEDMVSSFSSSISQGTSLDNSIELLLIRFLSLLA